MKVKCFVCEKEKHLEGTPNNDVRFYCSNKCWSKANIPEVKDE